MRHPHSEAKLGEKTELRVNVIQQTVTRGIAPDNYICVWDTEHGTSQIGLA